MQTDIIIQTLSFVTAEEEEGEEPLSIMMEGDGGGETPPEWNVKRCLKATKMPASMSAFVLLLLMGLLLGIISLCSSVSDGLLRDQRQQVLRLSEYTRDEARDPNYKIRIVFIGDSTMRYLFLTVFHILSGTNPQEWATCRHECPWNEKTFKSWPQFYELTSTDMFCDCVREHPCCERIIENRYASVGKYQLTYLQLFGDLNLKGNWLPGFADSMRRPHSKYTYSWQVNAIKKNVSVLGTERYDVLLWNLGHHNCSGRSINDLQQSFVNLARRPIFMKTIGVDPCKITPDNAKEIFDTNRSWKVINFWDQSVHLDGKSNWLLASDLLAQLNIADYSKRLGKSAR